MELKSPELPQLHTDRLILRLGALGDVEEILRYLEVNREFFRPTDPAKPEGFYTESFWREQVLRSVQEFYSDQAVRFFIFKKLPGAEQLIGTANFSNILRGPMQACFLGYGLAEREQGQGFMTEALRAAISFVFEQLNLHRVMANYMPANHRSGRVLERLGFVVEGEAKNYLRIRGEWQDHVLTSLTNPDWRAVPRLTF